MKNFFPLCLATLAYVCNIQSFSFDTPEQLFEMNTALGEMIVYRPSFEEMQNSAPLAKEIFVEAFLTTYTEYYRQSGSVDPIEKWLRLRDELTVKSWLSLVFDEEYEEYLAGTKSFLYLCNFQGELLGWMSHTPVSEKGEVYLSQCSLEAASRNHKVATLAFEKALEQNFIKQLFPGVKEVKLIARKINTIAQRLYLKAGFTLDKTIDPSIYGQSYDDRYIGFRLRLED